MITISELTPDEENLWRIDFFGYLKHTNQPLIRVWLSKVYNEFSSITDRKHAAFNSVKLTDFKHQHFSDVPISYLLILRIGQIWKNGSLHLSPSYRETRLNSVEISEKNCTTVLASSYEDVAEPNSNYKKREYYLPKTHHPYHEHCTKTSCEIVVHNGRKYIFPHIVLIQAYFQLNSWAFTQLFEFGIALDNLFYPQNTFCEDRKATVQLRPKVKDVSAPIIARIAFNKWANRAAKKISESITLQHQKGWSLTPATTFPFRGRTNLELRGKYLPDNFVVYDMISCSSAFPFDELDFYRDNAGKVLNNSRNQTDTPHPHSSYRPLRAIPNKDFNLLPDNAPAQDKGEVDIDIDIDIGIGTSLVALKEVISTRRFNEEKQDSDISAPSINNVTNASEGNTGHFEADGKGAKVDKSPTVSSQRDRFIFQSQICRLSLFRNVIQELQKTSDISNLQIMAFDGSSHDSRDFSYFPNSFTDKGKQRTWRFVSNNGKSRVRRALVVHFSFNEKSIAVVEAERRIEFSHEVSGWIEGDDISTLMIISHTPQRMPHYIKRLLQNCSDNNGVWQTKQQQELENHEFTTQIIRHPPHDTIQIGIYAKTLTQNIVRKLRTQL